MTSGREKPLLYHLLRNIPTPLARLAERVDANKTRVFLELTANTHMPKRNHVYTEHIDRVECTSSHLCDPTAVQFSCDMKRKLLEYTFSAALNALKFCHFVVERAWFNTRCIIQTRTLLSNCPFNDPARLSPCNT